MRNTCSQYGMEITGHFTEHLVDAVDGNRKQKVQ